MTDIPVKKLHKIRSYMCMYIIIHVLYMLVQSYLSLWSSDWEKFCAAPLLISNRSWTAWKLRLAAADISICLQLLPAVTVLDEASVMAFVAWTSFSGVTLPFSSCDGLGDWNSYWEKVYQLLLIIYWILLHVIM